MLRILLLALVCLLVAGSSPSTALSRRHRAEPGEPLKVYLDPRLSDTLRQTLVSDLAFVADGVEPAEKAVLMTAMQLPETEGDKLAPYMLARMPIILSSAACQSGYPGVTTRWQDGRWQFDPVDSDRFGKDNPICAPDGAEAAPLVSMLPVLSMLSDPLKRTPRTTMLLQISDDYRNVQAPAARLDDAVVEFDRDNAHAVIVSAALLRLSRPERIRLYARALSEPFDASEPMEADEVARSLAWIHAAKSEPGALADGMTSCGNPIVCGTEMMSTASAVLEARRPKADPATIVDRDPSALKGFAFGPTMPYADRSLIIDDLRFLWDRNPKLSPSASLIMHLTDATGRPRLATGRDVVRFILSAVRVVGPVSLCDDDSEGYLEQSQGVTRYKPFRTDVANYSRCQQSEAKPRALRGYTDGALHAGRGRTGVQDQGYSAYQAGGGVIALRRSGDFIRLNLDALGRSADQWQRISRTVVLFHESLHSLASHTRCPDPDTSISSSEYTLSLNGSFFPHARDNAPGCDAERSYVYALHAALRHALVMACASCSPFQVFDGLSSAYGEASRHILPVAKAPRAATLLGNLEKTLQSRANRNKPLASMTSGELFRIMVDLSRLREQECGSRCKIQSILERRRREAEIADTLDAETRDWMFDARISEEIASVSEADAAAYLEAQARSFQGGSRVRLAVVMPCGELKGCDATLEQRDAATLAAASEAAQGCTLSALFSHAAEAACAKLDHDAFGVQLLQARRLAASGDDAAAASRLRDLSTRFYPPAAWELFRMLDSGAIKPLNGEEAALLLGRAASEIPDAANTLARRNPVTDPKNVARTAEALNAQIHAASWNKDGFLADAIMAFDRLPEEETFLHLRNPAYFAVAETWMGDPAAITKLAARWSDLSYGSRTKVQNKLIEYGLFKGGVDGEFSPALSHALETLCKCRLTATDRDAVKPENRVAEP